MDGLGIILLILVVGIVMGVGRTGKVWDDDGDE